MKKTWLIFIKIYIFIRVNKNEYKQLKNKRTMQLLFDHFMDGIDDAAYAFYDLHPLKCKEFKSSEVISLFREFESIVVSKDPFWKKSSRIKYILDDGNLRELDLGNQSYYLVNGGYSTDTKWEFFNPMLDTYLCSTLEKKIKPYFESSDNYYKGPGICLRYLSVTSKMFEHYGEDSYKENIRPHTDIFKEAAIEIFSLKKLPVELIKKYHIDKVNSSFEWACENNDFDDFLEITVDDKNIRPLLSKRILDLQEEYRKFKDKIRKEKGKLMD